ncbi:M23 family metallopeptidase [Nocardia sp. NBC_01327]|uniref:M23 family metallopeptidase n=1 Tax=Nocardia sp. NBC_01327 TaxID=2903593 RepID=UPI002E1452FF|nr:peptidoglycan DD-metalloendopeptidase family protein [Nocardia sp. NBC_01327]
MSDGPFPETLRASRGHRYRDEAENAGGATHSATPQATRGQVSHGDWEAARSWHAPAVSRQPQPDWQAAQAAWEPRADTGAAGDWSAPAADGWAAPEQAGQSRAEWDAPADPAPSADYRPVYTFRTASGARLDFSGDGARVDQHGPEGDSAEPAPARSGGRRRAAGSHRVPSPPHSLKGRAAVVAVAAGAVVAAGQSGLETSAPHADNVEYQAAAQVRDLAATQNLASDAPSGAPQVLNVGTAADVNQFNDILQKGQKYAADLTAAADSKLRPLFTKFASGTFTSGFGTRWGVEHLGVDVAAPIGTPIYAVADGNVIDAGPASGFGMWVRLLHDDGTITVYGHVDTAVVSVGQRVLAGDQIATVGNRGFSTGPHCHFEVWLNGSNKIDPLPWLASRGISLGIERD